MPITHSTVVVVPDDGTSPVGSDEWNANHSISVPININVPAGIADAIGIPEFYVQSMIAQSKWSNDIIAPDHRFGKSRATSPGGAGTIVQANDVLGSIRFSGDLGSSLGLAVAAQILAFVDGTPSTTSMPGRLVFKTQAAGSIDPNNVITALVIYRDQSVEVTGTFFADTAVNIGSNAAPTSMLTVLGPVATKIPRTLVNATETMVAADSSLIANRAGTITLTLQSAASYPGRWLYVKTIQAQTLVSATSNVVPLVGGSAGPAILAATAGKWASLQSDGANWIIMAGN